MDKLFQPTLYWICDYLFLLGLKLIHVSKRPKVSIVGIMYIAGPTISQLAETELSISNKIFVVKSVKEMPNIFHKFSI